MTRRDGQETRYLCSDLVVVEYVDRLGRQIRTIGNLEEIWRSGARLLLESPVHRYAKLGLLCRRASFRATVVSCSRDFLGYFLEVQFEDGSRWSRRKVQPKHLIDPARVAPRVKHRQPAPPE